MPRSKRLEHGVELAVVFVVLALVFLRGRQEDYWGDGKFMILWLGNGRWDYYHVLFLPTAQMLHRTVGALLGWSAEETLFTLSHLAGAAGGTLVMATGQQLGFTRGTRWLTVALYASAPVIWFWSTCVEIHALQAAASALVTWWLARRWKRGAFGGDALEAAVLFGLIAGTHMSGLAWTPALGLLAFWGPRGWAWPRRLVLALLVFAASVVLWKLCDGGLGAKHVRMGADAVGAGWDPSIAFREVARPFGWLLVLLAVAVATSLERVTWRSRPMTLTAVLLVSLLPFAFTVDIVERGAYFVSLVPPLLLWIGLWMQGRRRRLALGLAIVVLPIQGWIAWSEIHDWGRVGVPDWALTLEQEAGPNTVLFTTDLPSAEVILRQSRLKVFVLTPPPGARFDIGDPTTRERALTGARRHVAAGGRVALTGEMLDHRLQKVLDFVTAMKAEFGEGRLLADGYVYLFDE